MVVVLDSFLAPWREPERRLLASPRRRGFQLRPGHVVLAIAAGCLALAWARARRQRPGASPKPEPTSSGPQRRVVAALPPGRALASSDASAAVKPAIARVAPTITMPTWADLSGSPDVASRWMERADQAIALGRPWALRHIAGEMERAGREAEAGLLNNYALLLERSRGSRARVRAEVSRMLQAALGRRRSFPMPQRRRSLAGGGGPAHRMTSTEGHPYRPALPEVEPLRAIIERARAVTEPAQPAESALPSEPALPVERRRRAAR
jgi:hypothetical protein